jgi:hypothetical protein
MDPLPIGIPGQLRKIKSDARISITTSIKIIERVLFVMDWGGWASAVGRKPRRAGGVADMLGGSPAKGAKRCKILA